MRRRREGGKAAAARLPAGRPSVDTRKPANGGRVKPANDRDVVESWPDLMRDLGQVEATDVTVDGQRYRLRTHIAGAANPPSLRAACAPLRCWPTSGRATLPTGRARRAKLPSLY